jgi:hypothetical protein
MLKTLAGVGVSLALAAPALAAPPNEVFPFEVISDTQTGPLCPNDCPPMRVPYGLARLTATHKALTDHHHAVLTNEIGELVDDGVVAFTSLFQGPNPSLTWPPQPGLEVFVSMDVQREGDDLIGNISISAAFDCALTMASSVDGEHWDGSWVCRAGATTHHFIAVVSRVPPQTAGR